MLKCVDSTIEFWLLADNCLCEDEKEYVRKFVLHNFEVIAEGDDFCKCSHLQDLLDYKLNITEENCIKLSR